MSGGTVNRVLTVAVIRWDAFFNVDHRTISVILRGEDPPQV